MKTVNMTYNDNIDNIRFCKNIFSKVLCKYNTYRILRDILRESITLKNMRYNKDKVEVAEKITRLLSRLSICVDFRK